MVKACTCLMVVVVVLHVFAPYKRTIGPAFSTYFFQEGLHFSNRLKGSKLNFKIEDFVYYLAVLSVCLFAFLS